MGIAWKAPGNWQGADGLAALATDLQKPRVAKHADASSVSRSVYSTRLRELCSPRFPQRVRGLHSPRSSGPLPYIDSETALVFNQSGRRATQNVGNGTANNVLLLSGKLRSHYASILTNWLGAGDKLVLGLGIGRLAGLVQTKGAKL